MTIAEVDPADTQEFHSWYEAVQDVWVDAWPGDPAWAGEEETRELLMDREDSERTLFIARTSSGGVAGTAEVRLPSKENRRVANLDISVRPTFRGAGVGRALLERARECASANGRTVHLSDTYGRLASLESRDSRFARAAGFTHARSEVRRELRLPLRSGHIEELEQANGAAGKDYELVSWWGSCPDDLVEGRARLAGTLTADEPHGDLEVEAVQFDVERIRRWERNLEKIGRELACTGALDKETRELAAVTEIGLPRQGEDLAMQFATVVAREHRGHRLGILVKLANLKLIEGHETAPRRICTWNAESNDQMIRVNDELGFEVVGMTFNWQSTS